MARASVGLYCILMVTSVNYCFAQYEGRPEERSREGRRRTPEEVERDRERAEERGELYLPSVMELLRGAPDPYTQMRRDRQAIELESRYNHDPKIEQKGPFEELVRDIARDIADRIAYSLVCYFFDGYKSRERFNYLVRPYLMMQFIDMNRDEVDLFLSCYSENDERSCRNCRYCDQITDDIRSYFRRVENRVRNHEDCMQRPRGE